MEYKGAKENAIKQWYNENHLDHHNSAWLTGIITEEFQYSHQNREGKSYYYTIIEVINEKSGISNFIKVIVLYSHISGKGNLEGMYISAKGKIRAYKRKDIQTQYYILADDVFFYPAKKIEELANINAIFLVGKICKDPIHRYNSKGRELTDIFLEIKEGKTTTYVPCIIWDELSKKVANLKIGDVVTLFGRMQSRNYTKVLEDGKIEKRITHEVSVNRFINFESK